MNLTINPWIPVLRADGGRALLSLHELFAEAHTLRDLAVKPHERIALMRLLLCISQAALDGPEDEQTWEECLPLIQPQVSAYLQKWAGSFELFGDGVRFLQFPNLFPGKEADEGNSATKLDLSLATGNNVTLFDNRAAEDRNVISARSALNLLTFQCFSPGGRIGVAKWNGRETAGNGSSNHAPCVPSSMVHSLLQGPALLKTLHLNLLSKETVLDVYGPDKWGRPVWELPVQRPEDSPAVENASATFLGRLVPVCRAIRLSEDGNTVILANGLNYPIFPAFREATATIRKKKDELALLPASTSRSLWRQLSAISLSRRAASDAASGPLALRHDAKAEVTTLWLGALVTDKAKIEDVAESTYSLPAGMFSEFGRAAYEKGVAFAEDRERAVREALKVYASTLNIESPAYSRASQLFWTRVEQNLSDLFELARNVSLAADIPACAWGKAVEAAAQAAYAQSCARQTARQIEAYARGLGKLNFRPKSQPTPAAHE